jgi:hypothetical protein
MFGLQNKILVQFIAGIATLGHWCNGNTRVFQAFVRGSIPLCPAKKRVTMNYQWREEREARFRAFFPEWTEEEITQAVLDLESLLFPEE